MDEEDVSPTELVDKLSLSELNLIRLQHDEDMTQRFYRFTVYIYQNKSGRLHISALKQINNKKIIAKMVAPLLFTQS